MKTILADIGGTHARFATVEDGVLARIEKIAVNGFATLQDALASYSNDNGALYIATAAWPWPDGSWRFARPDRWVIVPRDLEAAGWKVSYIGNDFGAGARGALALGPEHLYEVQKRGDSEMPQNRFAVLGSGTGLGLAYVQEGRIHETFGGQMEIPRRTDEHHTLLKLIKRLKDDGREVSAEDVISGPGLMLLYKAACMLHGRRLEDVDFALLLENRDDPIYSLPLRLYHEFLGMFAQQAVIYGHAFAGLFLDGGVLHKMVDAQAFDRERFLRFFIGEPVPIVKAQLNAMPVNIVTDPYVALRGLNEMVKHGA